MTTMTEKQRQAMEALEGARQEGVTLTPTESNRLILAGAIRRKDRTCHQSPST